MPANRTSRSAPTCLPRHQSCGHSSPLLLFCSCVCPVAPSPSGSGPGPDRVTRIEAHQQVAARSRPPPAASHAALHGCCVPARRLFPSAAQLPRPDLLLAPERRLDRPQPSTRLAAPCGLQAFLGAGSRAACSDVSNKRFSCQSCPCLGCRSCVSAQQFAVAHRPGDQRRLRSNHGLKVGYSHLPRSTRPVRPVPIP